MAIATQMIIFRFIEYLATSLYRIYKIRSKISKSATGLLRENEVNLTLANNIIWLLVWGIYLISLVGLLNVPTKSMSMIATGLAAGLGFAMKDILNNFFYGVQLMSGRLRGGDTIECDGIRGTVDNISYQTTTISIRSVSPRNDGVSLTMALDSSIKPVPAFGTLYFFAAETFASFNTTVVSFWV